ncbi:peptide deformylase [Synechococcus sp. PCC 6717]|jgi:peptide deformylase|uniref:Peptide deformylase n=1 Tax=Parathermosynechococcus lividus PCC 6715 TaxID=1917166 RepID=A0A2D2PZV2_PARLV|nr:peptide deformylase [Thermostichus lividus]ATS17743.1 peptide deformylase [Thermostichus lividus PCC 6715]MCI3280772.1 peptide deformylase [Synechococcus sp. PCC 6717]
MATSESLGIEKKKLKKPPLQLHYLGDRILRQPAKRVAKVDDSVRQIVRQMLQTMYSADGIGLAAPQVGINKQILVIDIHLDDPDVPPLVMINPVIKEVSEDLELSQEGCLSIPGVFLEVRRPAMVEVAYKDEWGRPQTLVAGGLLARAIQHEIDHLMGVMFVDRVENQALLRHELKEHGFANSTVRSIAA